LDENSVRTLEELAEALTLWVL